MYSLVAKPDHGLWRENNLLVERVSASHDAMAAVLE
jgi:hypothetical protein